VPDITKKYPSLSDVYRDLTLFFKLDNGASFSLADFTSIAEGRWDYFRNNWDFIKLDYLDKINAMPDGPNKVNARTQYTDFGILVENNRASSQNPLSNRNNLRKFKDLLDVILIEDLDVSQAEQAIIDNDLRRIANLEKDDFYEMRERVRITHDKTTDSMGLGDETYNDLYERVGGPQIISFRFDDYPILSSLISLMNQITLMIPTTLVKNERPDPFETVRRALNNPGIPVNSSTNGFLVPFPAGSTLERLAQKYLGNPDRALEIATANGLKFPYVDEVGRKVFLLINGISNIVIIPIEEAPNFFVDQEVFIGSDGKPLTRRKILSLEEDKNNAQLLITVNGTNNMSDYVTTQRAYVYSYMPYTINSNKFIMIPTAGNLGFPINAQEPWFVKELPNDVKNMGVDLALGPDFDLVFDNTGDFMYVYGLANAAQALNLKVQTKTKDLMRDPNFGIEEIAGKYKNSEITEFLLTLLIESAINGDDRFDGIDGLGYTITDTSVFINTTVRLKGSEGSIPLTFQLPKG
jgi:hypothetical protein